MNWFTSDPHFFHQNILEFCKRPYGNTDAMNWDIVRIINEHVKPGDKLHILGDYAFRVNQERETIIRLGNAILADRILVEGNHDYDKSNAFFGFKEIHKELLLKIGDRTFRLTHYPLKPKMTKHDEIKRPECFVNAKYDPSSGELYPLLCGHVHDEWATGKHCLNVGWDIWKRPLSENDIIKIYNLTNGFQDENSKEIIL